MTGSARVVVLTQPAPRVVTIAADLSSRGYAPLVLPFSTLETARFVNAVAAARTRIFGSSHLVVPEDPAWDLVVFVSPSAVLAFQGEAQSIELSQWPDTIAVATVGPGTLDALAMGGLPRSVRRLAPKHAPWDARSLLASIREEVDRPRRVLIVGGSTSGTDWPAEFKRLGIPCDWLTAYHHQPCDPDRAEVDRLYVLCSERATWVGVVTQAPTAEALNRLALDWPPQFKDWMKAQTLLTIHHRIEKSLIDAGFQSVKRISPGLSALDAALSLEMWSTPRQFP